MIRLASIFDRTTAYGGMLGRAVDRPMGFLHLRPDYPELPEYRLKPGTIQPERFKERPVKALNDLLCNLDHIFCGLQVVKGHEKRAAAEAGNRVTPLGAMLSCSALLPLCIGY